MKKICIMYIGFLYGAVLFASQNEGKAYHSLSHKMQFDFLTGGETVLSNIVGYGFFAPKLSVQAGVKNIAGTFGSSVFGDFMPLKKAAFSLGVHGAYNMNWMLNCCIENNILLGLKIRAGKADFILLSFDCSYLLKMADFYKLRGIIPLIIDHTPAVSLTVQAAATKRFLLAFTISSYDTFYYPLFFNPRYEVRGTWLINPHFQAVFFSGVRYSDMFTLTSYINAVSAGVSVQFKIPPLRNER